MKAQPQSLRCADQSALRIARSKLNPLAVPAIGCLLSSFAAGAQADMDPSIIWLGAGAHGAPCERPGRCAMNLGCDPASARCLAPARVELSRISSELCEWDDTTAIYFEAHNVGEIAAHENVHIDASVDAIYVDAMCRPDGPGVSAGYEWTIFNRAARTASWRQYEVPVQLDPGEYTNLTAYLDRSLPPYTYKVTVDATLTTPSGGYLRDQIHKEIAPVRELDETCLAPSICGL